MGWGDPDMTHGGFDAKLVVQELADGVCLAGDSTMINPFAMLLP
jgi:hypothetical protein